MMQDADFEVLGKYCREMADLMGLKDWTLLLKREPTADEEVLAEVNVIYGRRFAVIRVCKEFREITREEQRQVICHELVHCHHGQLGHVLERTLRKELGRAGALLMVPIRNEFETLVDSISMLWHDALPMIPWTTPDPGPEDAINAPYEGPIDHGRQVDEDGDGS